MRTSCSPGRKGFVARCAGSALALVLAASTAAAQTGVVSGSVTEASTGRALQQVRVQIVGNERAIAATDASGRFIIRDVPAGAATLLAAQIGFRPEARSITISGGDTVKIDLRLSQSAVELQQIVVCWFCGRIVQERVGTGFHEGVSARRADSDSSTSSWLLD